MIRRRLTGLAAALGIAVLLIGLPTLLLQVGFGTLPTITNWNDLTEVLLRRDDGTLALLVIKLVGWVTWALLAALILLETVSLARGIQPRDLPGLRMPQSAARHLVAAAAALFIAIPAATTPTPALADATPTQVVATAAQTPATSPAGARTPRQTATTNTTDARVETRPHTVRRGESLWSIADKELGNGRRYTEIAALNSTLLDGKGDDFLKPGWILTLPADPNSPAEPETAVTSYTVKKGDTLSEIALDHLGDASAYPTIAQASREVTQPDGRHLTDPNAIDVGWTLHIPHPSNDDERPAKLADPAPPAAPQPKPATHAPASAQPVAHPSTEPATAPQSAPATGRQRATSAQAPASDTVIDQIDADSDEQTVPGWLVGGLAGAGALLGGSMWLALRRRRAAQFRVRRPGRMIATPSPAGVPVEKTLATAGATAQPTVEFVDEALRRLAADRGRAHHSMPKVAALELSDTHLTIHLSEVAYLPAPWAPAPDRLRWQLALDTDAAQVGPLNPAVQAPYPQLVTVGQDDHNHRWLLNLEDSAVLRLTGDPTKVRDFARYLTAELALHPWSVDVDVECVAIAHEIVALNPRRVRHHDTDDIAAHVLADAVTMIDRTTHADTDITTARATLLDADLWQSRILLLDAGPHSPHVVQLGNLLRTQPGRTGAVLVLIHDTAGAAAVDAEEIHLTSTGRLQIPSVGLDLVAAVGLTSEEAAGCAALFAQAGNETDQDMPAYLEPADGWQVHANQAGQLLPDHTLPRTDLPADDAASLLPEPDEVYVDVAATTPEDLAALAPLVSAKVRAQVEASDPTLDDDLRTWNDPHCDLPKLKVLGPLTVRVAPTGRPTAAAGRKPYLSELLALLATRPHGATTDEVADAMGISTDRVRKDILTLRTWLGPNPRTGRPHIPDSRQTDAAKTRGRPAYQVEGLLTDADLFRRLRVRGETRGPEGVDDLRHALSLVTGTPFSQLRTNGGAWLADGDRLDQILLCAVVDVAHLVTTADLQQGNLTEAQEASELALRVAPNEETPRLDLAAVFDAQGHQHAADQLIRNDVCDRSDDEDCIPAEISQRTAQIIDQRQWLTHAKTRASA